MNRTNVNSLPGGQLKRAGRIFIILAVLLGLSLPRAGTALSAPPQDPEGPEGGVQRIWSTERVDAPQAFSNLTSRSLRLDSSNLSRIAYGGDHLYYARYDGNTWVVTTVDGAFGVGQFASLALDRNDNPHIAYYDGLNGALKYARYLNGQWIVQTLDGGQTSALAPETESVEIDGAGPDTLPWDTGVSRTWQDPFLKADAGLPDPTSLTASAGVGMYTSIAVNSSNRAHISYYDAANGDLKYAHETSSGWKIETLAGTGKAKEKAGKYSSIALDSDGDAHISFFNESLDNLQYIRQVDGDWGDTEIVEDSNGENIVGGYTSLALSGSNPRISYYVYNLAGNEGDLKYATRSSTGWNTSFVDKTDDTGYYTSLALDSDGRPRISYYEATRANLRYAEWTGSAWDIETLASSGNVGRDTSLAVDKNNNTHISYLDLDYGLLNEIYMKSGNWATRNIAALRDVGQSSSLALDSSDRPHFSYFNDTTDDLKYASRSGSGWQVNVVADAGSVGVYSDLALNPAGLPAIAYYDATNADLKYGWFNGSAWQVSTLDTGGDVGRYVNLVLYQNNPYITYYDATNGNLKSMFWNGSAWIQIDFPDKANDVGQYSSSVIDASGRYHISYYDATARDLKYATYTGAAGNPWTITILDSVGDVGQYSSIALDPAGNPVVSYYDATNGDLKLATFSGGSWSLTTLESAGDVGRYASLKISSAGVVFVSYFDATNGDLKLAERSGGATRIELVDSIGQVGMYTSLALDSGGNPNISYYDATNGDLKYTRGVAVTTRTFLPLTVRNYAVP